MYPSVFGLAIDGCMSSAQFEQLAIDGCMSSAQFEQLAIDGCMHKAVLAVLKDHSNDPELVEGSMEILIFLAQIGKATMLSVVILHKLDIKYFIPTVQLPSVQLLPFLYQLLLFFLLHFLYPFLYQLQLLPFLYPSYTNYNSSPSYTPSYTNYNSSPSSRWQEVYTLFVVDV